jgi:histidyl-tRNA synthetase
VRVEMEFGLRSLKSLMKAADRLGAARVLMVGDQELERSRALLRDMRTKEQTEIAFDGLVEAVVQIVKEAR